MGIILCHWSEFVFSKGSTEPVGRSSKVKQNPLEDLQRFNRTRWKIFKGSTEPVGRSTKVKQNLLEDLERFNRTFWKMFKRTRWNPVCMVQYGAVTKYGFAQMTENDPHVILHWLQVRYFIFTGHHIGPYMGG